MPTAFKLAKKLSENVKDEGKKTFVVLSGKQYTPQAILTALSTGTVNKPDSAGAGAGSAPKRKSGPRTNLKDLEAMVGATLEEGQTMPKGLGPLQAKLRENAHKIPVLVAYVSSIEAYNTAIERFWRELTDTYEQGERDTYTKRATTANLFYIKPSGQRDVGKKVKPLAPDWWRALHKTDRVSALSSDTIKEAQAEQKKERANKPEKKEGSLSSGSETYRETDTEDSETGTRIYRRETMGGTLKPGPSKTAETMRTRSNILKKKGAAKVRADDKKEEGEQRDKAATETTIDLGYNTSDGGHSATAPMDLAEDFATLASASTQTLDATGDIDAAANAADLDKLMQSSEGEGFDSELSGWSSEAEDVQNFTSYMQEEQARLIGIGQADALNQDMAHLLRSAPYSVQRDLRRERQAMITAQTDTDPMGFNSTAARNFFTLTGVPPPGSWGGGDGVTGMVA